MIFLYWILFPKFVNKIKKSEIKKEKKKKLVKTIIVPLISTNFQFISSSDAIDNFTLFVKENNNNCKYCYINKQRE